MWSVATAMGVDIVGAELHATGDADDVTSAKLGELTERYCVVGQSLAQMPSTATCKRAAP